MTFYGRVSKSVLCVCGSFTQSSRQVKDHFFFFFKPFGIKKLNKLVVPSNKLNIFAGTVRCGFGPDLTLGSPVGPSWLKVSPISCVITRENIRARAQ